MVMIITIILILISACSFWFGSYISKNWIEQKLKLSSRPGHYAWYAVIKFTLPAWLLFCAALLLDITKLVPFSSFITLIACLTLIMVSVVLFVRKMKPALNARIVVENHIKYVLIGASLVSIFTTIGIVLSILFEALLFFKHVNIFSFLTGTSWNPDTAFLEGAGRGDESAAKPEFGSLPIFAGTFMITLIALSVSVPVGLFAAIFLSEYASKRFRKIFKPVLEILAGIPTVVYGFFAALTVSPFIVKVANFFGINADYTNALAPGLVMGVMIIPFISSLSDDIISSVPQSLREGGLALGTTKSETIKKIILPAAMPGIVSAILLAVSRAVGETMIVVMAAGLRPNLTWNPLEGMTTVTVQIVDALTGDQAFDSLATLSAFGLGLVLLVFTLIINLVSTYIIRKYRKIYE